MKKTILRGAFAAVVLLLLLLLLFKNRSPFGKNNSSFASSPHTEITKIEFSEGGQRLSLENRDGKWLINGRNETRKSSILFILRVLKEMRIKSPVSPELFKSEITGKGIDPVRVKVFEKRKLLKTFLVYKTASNTYGNIMKIRERSKPFIVYVPGFEGDIGSGFSLNELYWQPYTVFNLLPSEIVSVDFENLTDTANSFSIFNRKHIYSFTVGHRNITGWDSALVARYLSYFTWIPFESWALNMSEKERKEIESRQPLYRITVNTTDGKKTVLTLWEKLMGENGSKTVDSDRLYGKTQNRDELFVIRYFDIDPLIKKKSYFFRE